MLGGREVFACAERPLGVPFARGMTSSERRNAPNAESEPHTRPPSDQLAEMQGQLVASVRGYAILMLDPTGLVLTWNAGAEAIKGYAARDIVGRHFSAFYTAEDVAAGVPAQHLVDAARKGRLEYEGWRVRGDGSQFWADVVITAIFDSAGVLRGFGKVTRDLTERRAAELETLHRSLHDALTGLPNRVLLADRLERSLVRLDRGGGSVAVLFIDLDGFKGVNDSYGHDSGDVVLVEVARRLLAAVRPEDTVCRVGGDEFVALCGDVADAAAVRVIADRIVNSLRGPVMITAGEIEIFRERRRRLDRAV